MQDRLFFVCPTDRLEPILNKRYRGINHYYASLGNSVEFNFSTLGLIKGLIRRNKIKKILFVLSSDNPILLDALGNQEHSDITQLAKFYKDVTTRNAYPMVLWYIHKNQISVAVSHLKNKIKELEQELNYTFTDDIKIEGKIFNKADHSFHNVSNKRLIWSEPFSLN